jgi:dihydroflavonol-4-reductase
VDGTENVLSLSRELNIGRVIYISTLAIFGDTGPQETDENFVRHSPYISAYDQTKTEAHMRARRYQIQGLPLIIVCPGFVIGPNDHSPWGYFVRMYIRGILPPMAWARDCIERHAGVDDTAEAIVCAAEKGRAGETYCIGGDVVTVGGVMSWFAEVPGRFPIKIFLPTWLAVILYAPLAIVLRMLGLPAFISKEMVLSGAVNYNVSDAKARRDLGWNPKPAREVWLETLAVERALRDKRKRKDIVSLLKPSDE